MKLGLIFLICFFLCMPVIAQDWVPSGTHTWYNVDLNKTRVHGGGPPYNYQNPADGIWKATNLTWVASGGNLFNLTNGHRSMIDGTTNIIKYEKEGHIIRQRAYALLAYRRSTHQRVLLDDTPDFSNRSFNDSIVTYTDIFPNVDLEIITRLGSLASHWVFHQAARDQFGTWWANNGSPSDAYWAVATRFDIDSLGGDVSLHDSTGQMDVSVDIDIKRRMDFKSDGNSLFHCPPEYLDQFIPWVSGDGEGTSWPVYRRIVHISGKKYLIEGVKWTDAQQVPVGDISHDTEFGNNTIYGSNASLNNRQRGTTAVPASSGTMDSITFYTAGGAVPNVHGAIYNAAGTTLIDSSAELQAMDGGWNSSPVLLGASITGSTTYTLWCWGGNTVTKAGAEAGVTRYQNTGQSYGAWPATITLGNTDVDEAISIYAVYTIDGAPAADISYVRRIKEGEGK